jgi:hypothetical protein
MKSLIKTLAFTAAMSVSVAGFAQEKKDTVKINPDPAIKKTAKNVGRKTAEIASKGAAKVVDKTYKGKVGPAGQTVYIDNKSKYYYVNSKGKRVYVLATDLKDSPNP